MPSFRYTRIWSSAIYHLIYHTKLLSGVSGSYDETKGEDQWQKQLYLCRSKAQCLLQGMMGLGLTCFQSGVHLHSESSFNPDLAPLHHLSRNPTALQGQCDVGRAVWASTVSTCFSFTFLPPLIITSTSSSSSLNTRSLFQREQCPADSKRHQHFAQTAAHQDWIMLKVSWALDSWYSFCYNAVQSINAILLHYSIMSVCDSADTFITAGSILISAEQRSWVLTILYSEDVFYSSFFLYIFIILFMTVI